MTTAKAKSLATENAVSSLTDHFTVKLFNAAALTATIKKLTFIIRNAHNIFFIF